ncbi:DUF4227 family protein [Paenibacillus thermoaerophilus]|jgi:hypothetical protein|uniref:DUF4227 family protein n=1 Tax=Paenibacillus thermoaerophilus TaxID=1215385 RepID=A0ABW2V735_9BACL|nr:DUF4227 family protein [Paenibacillus thermoaerophilus]TMV12010.1 DUF4227 family protein [Paenibacillus thermoaerophilus]
MIVSIRRWMARIKFAIGLVVLTVAVYYALSALTSWIEPTNRYKEPSGRAVKAFNPELSGIEGDSMLERLLFFYRTGE